MTAIASICKIFLFLPKQRLVVGVKVNYPAVEISYPITSGSVPPPVIKELTLSEQNVISVRKTYVVGKFNKSKVKRGPGKGRRRIFYRALETEEINAKSKQILKLFKKIATLTLSGNCFYYWRTGEVTATYQCVGRTDDFKTIRLLGYQLAAQRVNQNTRRVNQNA
jgi:hypothetical protein